MNISRIADIQPDGTWNSQHGLLYQILVTFEDGFTGQANAKSQIPPYALGDEVAYEVTGSYPKGQKIKITKDLAQAGNVPRNPPQTRQPAPQTRAPVPSRPTPPPPTQIRSNGPAGSSVNGQTVGMAVKLAGDILLHAATAESLPVDLSTLQDRLVNIASEIIRASQRLESGQLTPDSQDVPY